MFDWLLNAPLKLLGIIRKPWNKEEQRVKRVRIHHKIFGVDIGGNVPRKQKSNVDQKNKKFGICYVMLF